MLFTQDSTSILVFLWFLDESVCIDMLEENIEVLYTIVMAFERQLVHTLSKSSTAGLSSSLGRIFPPVSVPNFFPSAASPDAAGLGAGLGAGAGAGAGAGLGAGAGAGAGVEAAFAWENKRG